MDPKITEVLARLDECSNEDLAEFLIVLKDNVQEAAESKDVEALELLVKGLEDTKAVIAERAETQAAEEARISELLAQAAEGEEEVVAETEGDELQPEEEEEEKEEDPPVPAEAEAEEAIAAAAAPKRASVTVRELASRRPRSATPQKQQEADPNRLKITAAADVTGFAPGDEFQNREDLAKAMLSRWSAVKRGGPMKGQQFYPVAQIETGLGEDRQLVSDDAWGNHAKVEAVTGREALTASGGFCAPTEARYDMFNISETMRPLRDGLPRFSADRGGIRYITPFVLGDFDTATDVYTATDDENVVSKTQRTLVCGSETEVFLQAVTHIQKIGNFNERTHPEAVKHALDLGAANHARRAEKALFDAMDTLSTSVGTPTEYLSATRDILFALGRAGVAYRSRHRMDPRAVLRWVAPAWVVDSIRVDLAQQMPGDNSMAKADAEISGYFAAHNISPIWEIDNDPYGAQGAAALLPWKDSFESLLFAEGTFLLLDGGTLDLGIVRDSTLNLTNDFQFFMEIFENVAKVGVESLKLTLDTCANGLSAGSDTSPRDCGLGS